MKDETILNVEREALDLILKLRKEAGVTEKELGEKAFPQAKNPRLKISSLCMAEAKATMVCAFALAISAPFVTLLVAIQHRSFW